MIQVPPSTVQAVKVPPPTTNVTPVEVQVVNVPDKLQDLQRQAQVSGTVTDVNGNTITLNTAMGEITLSLPQLLAMEKDKLLQQLMNALQSQKQVSVTLQPGEPPEQAVILLPQAPGAAQVQAPASVTAPLPATPQPLALAPGATLTGVVLPPEILSVLPGTLSPPPSAQQIAQLAEQLATNFGDAQIAEQVVEQLPTLTPQAAQNLAAEMPLAAPEEIEIALPRPIPNNPNPQAPGAPAAPEDIEIVLPRANAPLASAPIQPNLPAPASLPQNVPVQAGQPSSTALEEPVPQAIVVPNTSTAPSPAPVTAFPAPPLSLIPPATVASPPPTAASLLTVGREVTINIVSITPPSAPPPVPNAPNQVAATVVGNGPNGQLIVKTDNAVLFIRQNTTAQVGANLLLSVEEMKPMPIPEITLPALTSLQQMIGALAQADPLLAQQFLQNLPQPNPQLPSVLLFMLNAFKRGDVREWMSNEAVDTLARIGKFELVAKMTENFARGGTPAHDPSVGEWRQWPIPMQADGKLHMLNLYVHQEGHGHGQRDDKPAKPGQVRFLIDVNMSRLGPMQLDGFVQPKKLDMIVRSEHVLPAALPNELRDNYLQTLGALGYTGSLGFQVGRKHWLVLQNQKRQSMTT